MRGWSWSSTSLPIDRRKRTCRSRYRSPKRGADQPRPSLPRAARWPEASMARKNPKRIGLAIVGAGRVGLFRGQVAARHPQVDFIGIAETRPERAKRVAGEIGAEFVTADYRELLARPEVTAAIISTDEHLHVGPILSAVDRGLALLIEKPLATELAESERVLKAIRASGVDAVVGYTQRF